MPSWITDQDGKWHPAKEKVALTNYGKPFKDVKTGEMVNTGEPYIYEGPCRAALFELWQIDKTGATTTLGENFRTNTEFLESYAKARQAFGFNTVDDYLKYLGYDISKAKAEFEKKAAVLTKHELPKRVEEIKRIGGGNDAANPGKNIKYGGFGEPEEIALAK